MNIKLKILQEKNEKLRYLLRQLFYFRYPIGIKLKEEIEKCDLNLWQEIRAILENPNEK